jgi:hypothetical protein
MGLVGGVVSPLACYPTTSQSTVAVLCPHSKALGGCLGEHPIPLGGAAVVVGDGVATRCLGTLLEGTASLGVGLGEVEQQGGTVSADDFRVLQEQGGDPLGVTHEGSEAGGGDDLDHGSQVAGGGGGLSPSLESILQHRGRSGEAIRQIGTVAQLAHGFR